MEEEKEVPKVSNSKKISKKTETKKLTKSGDKGTLPSLNY